VRALYSIRSGILSRWSFWEQEW